MRKIIFILIALISFSQAQTIQYIGAPTTTVISRGNFRTDSIFYLPKRSKTPTDTAAFRYQISDSSLYYWTGYQWTKVQSASSFASVDTTVISTRSYRQKGIDSVQYNVGLKVNISDTSTMLSPYLRGSGTSNYFPKFNATRSVINSKLYESNLNLLFNSTTPYITTSGISTIENNGTSASVYVLKTLDTARAYVSFGGANTMDINNLRAGDIRFYTNATLRGRFQTDGTFRLNSLTGTGSRIVVADDNGVLSASSSATGLVDTTLLSTRAYRQKGDDSLGAIIAAKGSGTVTSVATGYGLSGGTITTTGTLIADTLNLSTRAWRQKGIDSVMNETSLRISGSGTLNTIAKFSATRILTNSSLFDNGSQVQSSTQFIINPTSAGSSFLQFKYSGTDVGIIGTDNSISGGSASDFSIYAYGANNLDFWTNNLRRGRFNSGGELLINTTTDAGAYTLQNNGALYNTGGAILAATSGNVGIGTASPVQKFVVSNAGSEGFEFIPGASSNSNQLLSYNRATSAYSTLVVRASDYNIQIGTTAAYYINSSQESLFGTLTDAGNYRVQIDGNLYNTGNVLLSAGTGGVTIGGTITSLTNWSLGKILQLGIVGGTTPAFNFPTTSGIINIVNGYFDGAGYRYQNNGTIGSIEYNVSVGNAWAFRTATSGTAGNAATLTQIMVITNDGILGLGTTTPESSSLLDVRSTTRGFLPPRMTTTQRDAISSPAAGLVIYNTTTSKLQVYTTSWTDLH